MNHRPRRLQLNADDPPPAAHPGLPQDHYSAQLHAFLHTAPTPALLAQKLGAADANESRGRRRFFSIAAGAIVAVILGSMATWSYQHTHDLPHRLLQYVQENAALLTKSVGDSASDGLAKVGANAVTPPAPSAAKPCGLKDTHCTHLLLETPHGRVFATLLPSHSLTAEARVTRQGLISVVRPARQGSYSLIGASDKALAAAEKMLGDGPQRRI
ncbi:MAG: hypothetical protein ACFCUG_15175 [Thiotrichales bacterium]